MSKDLLSTYNDFFRIYWEANKSKKKYDICRAEASVEWEKIKKDPILIRQTIAKLKAKSVDSAASQKFRSFFVS